MNKCSVLIGSNLRVCAEAC